jgi:hypothetical protein
MRGTRRKRIVEAALSVKRGKTKLESLKPGLRHAAKALLALPDKQIEALGVGPSQPVSQSKHTHGSSTPIHTRARSA